MTATCQGLPADQPAPEPPERPREATAPPPDLDTGKINIRELAQSATQTALDLLRKRNTPKESSE